MIKTETLNNSTFNNTLTHNQTTQPFSMEISHINYGYLAEIFIATLFAYTFIKHSSERRKKISFCRIIFMTQHKCTETITFRSWGCFTVYLPTFQLFSACVCWMRNKITHPVRGVVGFFSALLCFIYFMLLLFI